MPDLSSPWAAAVPPRCIRPGWFAWRPPVVRSGCVAPCSHGSGYWTLYLQYKVKSIHHSLKSQLRTCIILFGWPHPAHSAAGNGPARATAPWCHRRRPGLAGCIQNRRSSAGHPRQKLSVHVAKKTIHLIILLNLRINRISKINHKLRTKIKIIVGFEVCSLSCNNFPCWWNILFLETFYV